MQKRGSKLYGLTVFDIDFQMKWIRADHQLQRAHTMEYIIEDTKTKNGEGFVPMNPEVMACFRRITPPMCADTHFTTNS